MKLQVSKLKNEMTNTNEKSIFFIVVLYDVNEGTSKTETDDTIALMDHLVVE
jgi:hypothetical protein